ncbi:helix-turn-helix domain-containing protein, partial [Roseovarius sp.]|uniref:helix-turn-helix domain-containing protein n=1 Tax=Roseovarius sp. TaxID=1486281 RepID=UPI0035638257
NHLAEAISIEDVARHLAMSRRGLDKRFFTAVGHTPGEELRRVRLRRGAELLFQTKLSVTEISARCGFAAVSSFDRAFREMMGMTPREYRSTHRAEM